MFFVPYDLEISNQELSYIVKRSEQWRGVHGERRKVSDSCGCLTLLPVAALSHRPLETASGLTELSCFLAVFSLLKRGGRDPTVVMVGRSYILSQH